ncbi:MAG TPA: transposase [Vicinamibacterales bacterium]|nr:transposase [Vicinamibacterales bacterium]
MRLWLEWFRCVLDLRPACARGRTFLWMGLALLGLSVRAELAGVTSFVRAAGLIPDAYPKLLHLFHSPGVDLERLTAVWIALVVKLFTPLRVGQRLVVVADGLKVPKEGRKMPAVKKLHQESANNSKPPFISGHSCQALALLVVGPWGRVCAVPLVSRIHEGLVFSNRDQRSLLDKLIEMLLPVTRWLESSVVLVADAYYASRKIALPLLDRGHHLVTRVRSNVVAYRPAPRPQRPRRGRPRRYGTKLKLNKLWNDRDGFRTVRSPLPQEQRVRILYRCEDLLWRPVGRLVRFVWIDHPLRGRLLLMTTDLEIDPLQVLVLYNYRFQIEVCFKQALHTLGTYAYRFWMMTMKPRRRGAGDQYLHHTSDDYRRSVRRKLAAYHRSIQLGCIAQGLLQHLALNHRQQVWRHFRSWMRTMNPAAPPSEAVVAEALRGALPEFLLIAPDDHELKKFLLDHADPERCGGLQLSA